MADVRSWSYHRWLVVMAIVYPIVYLVAIWSLAIWHFLNSLASEALQIHPNQSLKTILESDLEPLVLWGFAIILIFLINCSLLLLTNRNSLQKFKPFVFYSCVLIIIFCFLFTYICIYMEYKNGLIVRRDHHIDRKVFLLLHGGLIICLWASSILAILLLINYTWPKQDNHFATTTFLGVIFFLSLLIYFFPNTKIKDDYWLKTGILTVDNCRKLDHYSLKIINNGGKVPYKPAEHLDEDTIKLIHEEHEKAIQEINQRTIIDDFWFHNKFILVGALFGLFLTYLSPFNPSVRSKEGGSGNSWLILTKHIKDMFKTAVPSSVLGMACVVSLAIDLHMRNNAMITRQLGLWIKNFVECLLSPGNIYIGWERFLRVDIENINGTISIGGIKGMHMQILFGVLDAAHFYFTSIVLYILYIACLIHYFSSCKISRGLGLINVFALIFILVHVTLIIFAIGGNSFPSTLEVQLALWPDRWFSGSTGGVIPSATCLLVTYLAFVRLFTLYHDGVEKEDNNLSKP